MTLVIHASVALRWFVESTGTPAAVALLDREVPLIAPDLVVAEVSNAAWKLVRAQQISPDHGRQIAGAVASSFSNLVPLPRLVVRAYEIAAELEHPVYDCFYVALAELDDARLVTADDRLSRRLAGTAWADRVERLGS